MWIGDVSHILVLRITYPLLHGCYIAQLYDIFHPYIRQEDVYWVETSAGFRELLTMPSFFYNPLFTLIQNETGNLSSQTFFLSLIPSTSISCPTHLSIPVSHVHVQLTLTFIGTAFNKLYTFHKFFFYHRRSFSSCMFQQFFRWSRDFRIKYLLTTFWLSELYRS